MLEYDSCDQLFPDKVVRLRALLVDFICSMGQLRTQRANVPFTGKVVKIEIEYMPRGSAS
jgi:hypothetical protein